jgi:flagellar export protein FliJ
VKRFVFNLQTVLDVRRIREDQLRAELAALCVQERQAAERLADLRRQQVQLGERVLRNHEALTGADLLAAARAAEQLRRVIEESDQQRQALAERRETKAEETSEAATQRKMLENLREKALGRHRQAVAVAAERQTDDLCARRRGLCLTT